MRAGWILIAKSTIDFWRASRDCRGVLRTALTAKAQSTGLALALRVPALHSAGVFAMRINTAGPAIIRKGLITMYITDLKHFLDANGAIAPIKGPAREMAQFLVDVTAAASSQSADAPLAPSCFKCKKEAVDASVAPDAAIIWFCPRCQAEGRISNWQATLWDLTGPQGFTG